MLKSVVAVAFPEVVARFLEPVEPSAVSAGMRLMGSFEFVVEEVVALI